MNDNAKQEELIFTDNKNTNDAVLGTLEGPCADFIDSTRNGRHYSDELWENVFADGTIASELIENGGIPGEMDHPIGREETDSARIAILMKDKPKKKKDGKLWAKFQILNTPLGKIAHTLAKAGFNLGISSRGTGDTYVGKNGEEYVDENSYDFKAFDLVLIPAVKDARLHLVTEGFQNSFNYKKELLESLNSVNDEDRKIMKETLDNLGINVSDESNREKIGESLSQPQPEKVDNINATIEHEKANNDGNSLVEELQNTLLENQKLTEKIANLQEKLSVCYAKEIDLEDEINKHKNNVSKLSESVKSIEPLKKRVNVLTEQLEKSKQQNIDSTNQLTEAQNKIKKQSVRIAQLKESLNNKDSNIKKLNESNESINSQSNAKIDSLTETINELNKIVEDLETKLASAKKDAQIKQKEYSTNLEKQNTLVERYKKIAKLSVDKFVESQAIKLGVSVNEIKSRLNENYSFKDIEKVCDEIQDYRLGLNNLPFSTNFQKPVKMTINESINPENVNSDDVIDSTLLSLMNQF